MSRILLATALTLAFAVAAHAADTPELWPDLPIVELTVFKDGHAFVVHEGDVPTTESGDVVLDGLPNPVLGTFWPACLDDRATLVSVVSGTDTVQKDQAVADLPSLLRANVGRKVVVTDHNGEVIPGTIVEAGSGEAESGAQQAAPPTGDLLLLRTDEGLMALSMSRVRDVRFPGEHSLTHPKDEERHRLTLRLDWGGRTPAKSVRIGLVYVQFGFRWIPGYRVDLDGEGLATVELEGTLINELATLHDATVHLVVGVPNITFAGKADPMGLQQAAAAVSRALLTQGDPAGAGMMLNTFSNSIMTQTRMSESVRPVSQPALDLGPDVQSQGTETGADLFVFDVPNVSLRKHERMVVPIAQYEMDYADVHRLVIPPLPPMELRAHFDSNLQARYAQALRAPKVVHVARLHNTSAHPLTTAPALVLRDGMLIGQTLMAYTSQGGYADVELTKAINIQVQPEDTVSKRGPESIARHGTRFERVHMRSTIDLTNFRRDPVTVEVVRYTFGTVEDAGEGTASTLSLLEAHSGSFQVDWEAFRHVPWWHHINDVGRIVWTVELKPGKSRTLEYDWGYFAN
ncbi:MAG: DUF4139 domain-containing protein [bacterium]|nr:DUF4139 domain-containing protein [bacterium]